MQWFKKKIEQVTANPEFSFKKMHTFSQRENKRRSIDEKYIGERANGISYLVVQKSAISKISAFKKPFKLFAIDNTIKIIDLIAYIRTNLKMTEKDSVFLIIGKTIANSNYTIGELYKIYAEPDGFLYVTISESEVF